MCLKSRNGNGKILWRLSLTIVKIGHALFTLNHSFIFYACLLLKGCLAFWHHSYEYLSTKSMHLIWIIQCKTKQWNVHTLCLNKLLKLLFNYFPGQLVEAFGCCFSWRQNFLWIYNLFSKIQTWCTFIRIEFFCDPYYLKKIFIALLI